MASEAARQPRIFLSTLLAGPGDRRQAGAAIAVFGLIFAAAVPYAKVQLPQVWAFIPSYQAALIVNDLVTAILLSAQFVILRHRALLALALGYLFTALMGVAHALSFPGLFAPGGLMGSGPQTTAWLYMAWHAGFPLAVIFYALAGGAVEGDAATARRASRPRLAIGLGSLAVVAAVCALTWLATAGHGLLPAIMVGDHYTDAMLATIGTVWGLSFAALLLLALRRPHSVLDLWVIAVLAAWLCDIGLSAAFNHGRFDLGFYAGRIFGLCAASFVLIVLLLETGALYARLASGFEQESAAQERRLRELQQELIHVARLSELGQMVSALTHEINQPLAAVGNYLGAAKQLLQDANAARAGEMIERAAGQIVRAAQIIERVRLLVRKEEVERRPDDLAVTVSEAAALALTSPQAAGLHLQVLIDPAMPRVLIDRVQIQQVLLNLIRNAMEAMQAGTEREIVIRAAMTADGMAEIGIADSGPGLDAAVRERLFQPFVTTKDSGLGVGLSICRSIIELHGGEIWATDNASGGTVFHFTVPLVRDEAEGRRAA